MKSKHVAACKTCQVAVETEQSNAAYNNSGVLRAYLGDAAGAMEDFARATVRPENLQRRIEGFMRCDARMIASSNFAVATEFSARRGNPRQTSASRVRGANIEALHN